MCRCYSSYRFSSSPACFLCFVVVFVDDICTHLLIYLTRLDTHPLLLYSTIDRPTCFLIFMSCILCRICPLRVLFFFPPSPGVYICPVSGRGKGKHCEACRSGPAEGKGTGEEVGGIVDRDNEISAESVANRASPGTFSRYLEAIEVGISRRLEQGLPFFFFLGEPTLSAFHERVRPVRTYFLSLDAHHRSLSYVVRARKALRAVRPVSLVSPFVLASPHLTSNVHGLVLLVGFPRICHHRVQ